MGSSVSTRTHTSFGAETLEIVPHLTARDAKGLLFSALRSGKAPHGSLTHEQCIEQISEYRRTLQKWVVDARDESRSDRLRPELAEELLESNWRARNVERAYTHHVGRQSRPSETITFVLDFCTVREWIECAAVCKSWSESVCSDDTLWAEFLANICAPSIVSKNFQICKSLTDRPPEASELPTLMLLTGPIAQESGAPNDCQSCSNVMDGAVQIWDSFQNRELVSAHLSLMPNVLPPSELSAALNSNTIQASEWKWSKMIGWVGFFEVASRLLASVSTRVSVWAGDPDCLKLSINRNTSFSELQRLQTGEDGQLFTFNVEDGGLIVKPLSSMRIVSKRNQNKEYDEDSFSDSEGEDKYDGKDELEATPRVGLLARGFCTNTNLGELERVSLFVKELCSMSKCCNVKTESIPSRYPATRPAFTALLLARVGRLLLGHAISFDLEFAGTVFDAEAKFLKRFPSAFSQHESLPKKGNRRAQYQNNLWAITTEKFSICFDIQRAELHLENFESQVSLWNEFHLRRTQLGMEPKIIIEDLARDLVQHYLTSRTEGMKVITTEVANRRWQTLLFLHWVYCNDDSQNEGEEERDKNYTMQGCSLESIPAEKNERRRNSHEVDEKKAIYYVNEGLSEKAEAYLRNRISDLLKKYVLAFQHSHQPESSELWREKENEIDAKNEIISKRHVFSGISGQGESLSMRIIVEDGQDELQNHELDNETGPSEHDETPLTVRPLSEDQGLKGDGGSSLLAGDSIPGSMACKEDRSWLDGASKDNFAVPSPRESEILGITSPREEL